MQKYCKEIESKTKSARLSIYIQWDPEAVNFHIAGLEEGIKRAVELIREEFLPQEVYKFTWYYCAIKGGWNWLQYCIVYLYCIVLLL